MGAIVRRRSPQKPRLPTLAVSRSGLSAIIKHKISSRLPEVAMTTLVNIGEFISTEGDRPHIANANMSIQQVVALTIEGLSPTAIVDEYPHLSLAQVHAALTYYYANQSTIDQALTQEKAFHNQMAAASSLA